MTVKQLLRSAVYAATAVFASAQDIDLSFFPGIEDYSDESIRLHGLAQLYPGRVLFDDPRLEITSASHEAARVDDLPRDIKYIRLYRLDETQQVLSEYKEHPALIVDFRYLKSELAAINLLHAFAQKEWLSELTLSGKVPEGLINKRTAAPFTQRDKPVVVLCNRETAGPFEAILDQLQRSGAIIAVGEPSAGRTGFYNKTGSGAWTLHGEIRPDADTSLVGVGFQPRILIETSAEENYLSYHLYEAGTPITRLLRDNESKSDSDEAEKTLFDNEPDRVLQRGVDIVAALQILE
jgi:hypothetical protein